MMGDRASLSVLIFQHLFSVAAIRSIIPVPLIQSELKIYHCNILTLIFKQVNPEKHVVTVSHVQEKFAVFVPYLGQTTLQVVTCWF